MAQNITIMGANYSAVPAVTLPKTGGGTASFTDVTDTTAAASDVASGKYFYTAAGVRTQGTNSGGGGSSDPYDFVIKCLGSFNDLNLNQLTIEKGTLQEIEEKTHDDQNPVTGCLMQYRHTLDPSLGYVIFEKYNLVYADVDYRSLLFASQRKKNTDGGGFLWLYYDEYYVINDCVWAAEA